MRAVDLLRAVRDGSEVTASALQTFVEGIVQGHVPDYQASAFLMAVCTRGLSDALTLALTLAMRDSGACIDMRHLPGIKVDKHSTGGVGDKISLALAPVVAACGVPVPMVSGRGLGHTGGTLDKLESIPGFRTDYDAAFFTNTVGRLGLCLIGQTAQLAPADKKLYALRDVTATVESVPLITSSILSKKLAEGIDALVLDVKVGRGAFMRDLAQAKILADMLVRVGQSAGLRIRALLTRMDSPLGRTIGNALEVVEAIDILHGRGPADTTALTLTLAAHMLMMGGKACDEAEGMSQAQKAIASGAAAQKFCEVIEAQGGDPRVVEDPARLPSAAHQTTVVSTRAGFVADLDPFALAQIAMRLGAGRAVAADKIDPAVGLALHVGLGDPVAAGQPLCTVHHNGPFAQLPAQTLDELRALIHIGHSAPPSTPLIFDRLG